MISTKERSPAAGIGTAALHRGHLALAPLPLWEEDWSELNRRLAWLRTRGIGDLRLYLSSRFDEAAACAALVRVVDANEAALAFFGVPDVAGLDHALRTYAAGQMNGIFLDKITALSRERTTFEREAALMPGGGEVRYVQFRLAVTPGYEASGKSVLVSLIDISSQKRAELQARRSEETYRYIFNNAGTATALADDAGAIVLVNGEFEMLSGYPRSEIEGKMNLLYFVPDEDREQGERYNRKLWEGPAGSRWRHEARFRNAAGVIRNVLVSGTVIPGMRRSIVSFVDITERRAVEDSLRASDERLRLIIDHSPNQLFQQDRDLRYVWAPNRAIPSLPEDVIGKTDREIFPSEDAEKLVYLKRRVIETGQGVRLEVDIGRRCFDAVFEPWRDSGGAVAGILGFMRDITGSKQAREELRRSYERERKTTDAIIETMVKIVEIRDPYTAGHEKHTAELAAGIAREMGLSDDSVNAVRLGAVVHDIGKIYVPAEILNKPGELSDLEFDIIKIHSSAGYDILKIIDFPWPVAEIVHQHHERYNGSGYPRGLAGHGIRIEARILAVADVIDSIALQRPYRPRIGLHQAVEEITENRGILYDPDVVDAMIRLLKKRGQLL